MLLLWRIDILAIKDMWRRKFSTSQYQPRSHSVPNVQGRTAVENWLLVAGSGIVGSLVTLTWRLVQGFTVAEPVNKALMAAILVCMLLIVVLTSLSKLEDKPRPAAA